MSTSDSAGGPVAGVPGGGTPSAGRVSGSGAPAGGPGDAGSRWAGPPGAIGPPGPEARVPWSATERAFALVLVLLLGVRFVGLEHFGLWIDEAHTLHDALSTTSASSRYPLGYWVTRLAIFLCGGAIDEATLRLAPAVCGVLGPLLLVWAFAPALGRGRALAAGLFCAASAWHLYWSQSARAYTLMQDLSLVGAGLYLRGLLEGRPRTLLAGFAVGGLAAFAHPSAALLLPAWVLAPLLLPRLGARLPVEPPRRVLLTVAVGGGVVLSGWAAIVLLDFADSKETEDLLASWEHFVLTTGFYVTPWLGAGALLGGVVALRARRAADLLALAVVVGALGLALVMAVRVRVSAQYVFALLPWIAALATVPLAAARGGRAWRLSYAGLVVLPGLVSIALYLGPGHGNRPRWREAYAHVFEHRRAQDLVFGMAAVVGQYYLDPGSVDLRQHRDLVRLNGYTAKEPARWSRYGRRTWFVVRREDLRDWPAEDRAAFETLLAEECRLELSLPVRFTPRDLSVEVWVREPWASSP